MAKNEEDRICTRFFSAVQRSYPAEAEHLFHVPNGGKRGKMAAIRFKAMGVRRGVSDYFLALPRRGYAGLWIEVKTDKGRIEPDQIKWIRRMRTAGYAAIVVIGYLEAMQQIKAYIEGDIGAMAMHLNTITKTERNQWIKENQV